MKITVYGPGCPKCREAEELVRKVAGTSGAGVVVEKVSDLREMMRAGVITTPAVAVDGALKVAGRVPREQEVRSWIGGSGTVDPS